MSRLVVLGIFLIVILLLDFYVFQGFKLLIKKWAPNQSALLHFLYWAIPIVLLMGIISSLLWSDNPTRSRLMMWCSSLLFGLFVAKFFWALFMVADDVLRFIKLGGNRLDSNVPNVRTISRSEFLVTTGALLAGTVFGSLVHGILRGAHNFQVFNRNLKLKNLPKAFQGFKIVQISDVHSGSFWNKSAVERGIQLIIDQKPDVVFFTGDLVNSTSAEFIEYKEMFSRIQAPYGVFAVLGNHDYGDYYTWPDKNGVTKAENLQQLLEHHKDMGWELLMNENRVVEKDGEQLAVLGVENWSAHRRFPKYGILSKAYQGVEHIENKLLLSHDPSHWRAEVLKDYPSIDAMFAGHTHGMQFGIDTKYYKWSPVKYQYPEWADLYEENGQYLYVNRGFGYLGYPGRVGFLPEITVFELGDA